MYRALVWVALIGLAAHHPQVSAGSSDLADPPEFAVAIDALAQAGVDSGQSAGISVAVVRSGRIAWTRAYGVANAWLRTPLTTDTPLPAASLGKPVTALVVLRLVDRGRLSLDAPVANAGIQLESPKSITIRQLLTHSAGLSNFLGERTHRMQSALPPRFRYSGVGYVVLQDVVEAVEGSNFATVSAREVLQPIGTESTSFDRANLDRPAAPHIALAGVLVPGAIALAVLWPIFALLVVAWRRWKTRQWEVRLRDAGVATALATLACLVFLFERSGSWRAALFFTAVPLALGLPVAIGIRIARRSLARARAATVVAAVLLACIGCTYLLRDLPVPVPELGARRVSAASSLHASANDLARLMIEFTDPALLNADFARSAVSAHQPVNATVSWGLGIGLAKTALGDVAWHRGSSPGAQGLMLINLVTGDGVVVLANSGGARKLVDTIANAATNVTIDWVARSE